MGPVSLRTVHKLLYGHVACTQVMLYSVLYIRVYARHLQLLM